MRGSDDTVGNRILRFSNQSSNVRAHIYIIYIRINSTKDSKRKQWRAIREFFIVFTNCKKKILGENESQWLVWMLCKIACACDLLILWSYNSFRWQGEGWMVMMQEFFENFIFAVSEIAAADVIANTGWIGNYSDSIKRRTVFFIKFFL